MICVWRCLSESPLIYAYPFETASVHAASRYRAQDVKWSCWLEPEEFSCVQSSKPVSMQDFESKKWYWLCGQHLQREIFCKLCICISWKCHCSGSATVKLFAWACKMWSTILKLANSNTSFDAGRGSRKWAFGHGVQQCAREASPMPTLYWHIGRRRSFMAICTHSSLVLVVDTARSRFLQNICSSASGDSASIQLALVH